MPRPQKCRRICSIPANRSFGPLPQGDCPNHSVLEMTLDEYETIRLIDLLGYTQEECACQMSVARTTVQAIYNSARHKTADALVNGRQLLLQGGSYAICAYSKECCGKNLGSCCCHKGQCKKKKANGGKENETCSDF